MKNVLRSIRNKFNEFFYIVESMNAYDKATFATVFIIIGILVSLLIYIS